MSQMLIVTPVPRAQTFKWTLGMDIREVLRISFGGLVFQKKKHEENCMACYRPKWKGKSLWTKFTSQLRWMKPCKPWGE